MLGKLGADAATQHGTAMAQDVQDRLRQHFVEKTLADQSTMAGVAVQSNLTQAGNAVSQAAYSDPSSMSAGITIMNGLIDAQIKAHNLDPDTATRIRDNLAGTISKNVAESAARGLGEQNPDALIQALDNGTFDKYFTGQEASVLRNYAVTQSKLNTTLVQKQNKDQADSELNSIQASTIGADGNLTIPKDYFANVATWMSKWAKTPGVADTALSSGRTAIDYGRSIMDELAKGKPAITDPATYENFSGRLTLSQDDPNALTDEQIIRARADGKLSDKDFNFFKESVATLAKDPAYKGAQAQFKTFMSGIKSSITRSNVLMGSNDPAGDQKYLQFQQAATDEFERAYKRGDGSWKALLDRNAKNSLWQQSIPYMTDQKGAMQNLQNSISGTPGLVPSINAPKRNPGESAADYLRRTGGP